MSEGNPSPERWLPVPGYEGAYEVSDLGTVRSTDRITKRVNRGVVQHVPYRGQIRKPVLTQYGYESVGLRGQTRLVHHLVLEAFVGPRPDGLVTRHLNGVKTDNSLQNLVYGTYSENILDEVRLGTHCNTRKVKCPAGHEYSSENTKAGTRPNGRSYRECRQCQRDRTGAIAKVPGWCRNGHELAVAGVHKQRNGFICAQCARDRVNRYQQRKQEASA